MTGQAPRPTREQLADALASADIAVGPSMPTLAAEVRALRAELERVHDCLRHESDAHIAERARLRAALAARTPQPAAFDLQVVEQGPGRGCARVEGRCPSCGSRSLFLGAGARVTCASLSCPDPSAVDSYLDPAPPPAERCTPEEEAHDEMRPGCATCLHPDAGPLPAVPDGPTQ